MSNKFFFKIWQSNLILLVCIIYEMALTELKQWGACLCLTLETEIQCRIHFQLDHWLLTLMKFFNERKEYNFFGFFSSFFKNRGFCDLILSLMCCFSLVWLSGHPADPAPSCSVLAIGERWQDTAGGRFFQREEFQIVKGNWLLPQVKHKVVSFCAMGKPELNFKSKT